MSVATGIAPQPLPPLLVGEPARSLSCPEQLEEVALRNPPKIAVAPVASHFTADELREAKQWLAKHASKLPQAYWKVFPDALQQRIARELRQSAEKRRRNLRLQPASDDDSTTVGLHNERRDFDGVERLVPDDVDAKPVVENTEDEGAEFEAPDGSHLTDAEYHFLVNSAPSSFSLAQDIIARLETQATASQRAPRRNRSADRFMATADEYLDPYLAVKNGMSPGQAAKKFNIVDIRVHMAAVEQWLSMLEVAIPKFNRSMFLTRLERAIEKRREDAINRVGPVGIPRALRVKRRPSLPRPVRIPSMVPSDWPGTVNPTGVRLDTPETRRVLAGARARPLTRTELRIRQLERGLIALLDVMPHSPESRQLVRIADLAVAGNSQRDIAGILGMNRRTVAKRLELILKAGETENAGEPDTAEAVDTEMAELATSKPVTQESVTNIASAARRKSAPLANGSLSIYRGIPQNSGSSQAAGRESVSPDN
jgi:hypothetical protein